MATKRMMAQSMVSSDAFLCLSTGAQALYFHILVRADDEGFVNNALSIARMVGSTKEDLDSLVKAKFLLRWDDGVVCVKHWYIHNVIRMGRLNPTEYLDHRAELRIEENGTYTLNPNKGKLLDDGQVADSCQTSDSQVSDKCQSDVRQKHAQLNLTKLNLTKLNNDKTDKTDKTKSLNAILEILVRKKFIERQEIDNDPEWEAYTDSLIAIAQRALDPKMALNDLRVKTKHILNYAYEGEIGSKFPWFKSSLEANLDKSEWWRKANEFKAYVDNERK